MYSIEDIRTIHLEVTSKCNASCPMCLRNVFGGVVNPHLPLVELSLADIQQMIPPGLVRQLSRLFMCGNYGDPMVATDTLEILRYLRANNESLDLEIFTNGSGRPPEWWAAVARVVNRVRFGIDGLEDTNAVYRRGTKWPLILRSLTSFVAAGGRAEWDFIVFRHNEHQVEEARALAKTLGVAKFNVKKTGRFFSNTQATVKDRQEVHNREGQIEYFLEQPQEGRYRNSALQREDEINREFGSLKNFLAVTPIDCKVAREKSLYISAEGLVFPCCWTANQLYPWYYGERQAPIWKILMALPQGLETISAKRHSIAEILQGEFFQSRLPESWSRQGMENGRLFVCAKTCGRGFDAFKAQFEGEGSRGSRPSQEMSP